MKIHLSPWLRRLLVASLFTPVTAALTWRSGDWNTSDASWSSDGEPEVFSNGDAVEFTANAESKIVHITETVEPASMLVNAAGFVFSGAGSVAGGGVLTLVSGATLAVQNENTFTGGTVVEDGALLVLNQFSSVGSSNTNNYAIGAVSGGGTVEISLAAASTQAAILGTDWQNMNGVLYVRQGSIGLGRNPQHGGSGWVATMGARQVNVGSAGSFMTSLGGGNRGLTTNRIFSSDVRTEAGATIGNRDGHVNWSGNLYLNMVDVSAAEYVYNDAATTVMSLFYGKDVVLDGVLNGEGVLAVSAQNSDGGSDHRLTLSNAANSFSGTFNIQGEYLSTLALAAESAAASADVQLDTDNARLILVSTNATISKLNGAAGLVSAEGRGSFILSLSGGNFEGRIRDSASGAVLGITKTGTSALTLKGEEMAYTGTTSVLEGSINFTGDVSLGNVTVAGTPARLIAEGNLSLRSGAVVAVDVAGSSEASIQVGGRLILADGSYALHVSGYEDLPLGNYDMLRWAQTSAVTSGNLIATGLTDTEAFVYSIAVQENALQLVVGDMGEVAWLWSGDSATWSDTSSAEWSNASGTGPAGQSVVFSPRHYGTVTIDEVTPANIRVLGGEYTFIPESEDSAGIVCSGTLTVSGNSTVLHMNLNNTAMTGRIELRGGTLVLGAENAIGSADLHFYGGLLRYGSGVATDVSSHVYANTAIPVLVDTNGNDVVWSTNSGVLQTLQAGITKSGDGELQLDWTASGDSYAGGIEIREGTLFINKLSQGGSLNGSFSGSGTLRLSSPTGLLTIGGDNRTYTGTVLLSGDGQRNTGSVRFMNGAAFGGADTLVQVAGQRFWFASSTTIEADLEIMDGTSTYFDGSTGVTYSFTGNVSGSGTLQLVPSSNIVMSGDVSSFTGVVIHPGAAASTWLFGGTGISGNGLIQAELSGISGAIIYTFQYDAPVVMSGVVSGAAQLRQSGSAALSLTGQNSTTGNLVIDAGSELRLGTADSAGEWSAGAQLGTGQFTLVNGTLAVPLTTIEGILVADVAAGAVVDMGGTAAASLESITVNAGGLLTGLSGELDVGAEQEVKSLALTPAAINLGATGTLSHGEQVMVESEGGSLKIYDSASVSLDLETVKNILENQRQLVYIHVSNVDLVLQSGVTPADLFENSATSPEALGLVVLGVDGGNIVLEGAVRDVYMVTENGDYPTVSTYDRLQAYKATFVDAGYTLSLNLPGDNTQQAWVNNLLGGGNFVATNTSEATGIVRVILNNEVLAAVDGVLSPEQDTQINTANTELLGNITAGKAVQLIKTGSGTLTVAGTLTADWLEIDGGSLSLTGTGSAVNSLHGSGALQLDGSLSVNGNALDYVGSLSGSGSLELNGRMYANGSIGSLQGSGDLLAAGTSIIIQNLKDSVFSGSFAEGTGAGLLIVLNGGGRFTMQQVPISESWSVQNSGKMTLLLDDSDGNSVFSSASLELLGGSDTHIQLNTDKNLQVFSLRNLLVEDSASVTLISSGNLPLELSDEGTLVLGSVDSGYLGSDGKVPLTLGSGTPFRGIESAWLTLENGLLIFHAYRNQGNRYAAVATTANARTGAEITWQIPNSLLKDSPDLRALTNALDAAVAAADAGAANHMLAAAAGAGSAVLGMALAGDLDRQLKAIRNRTTSMGLDPGCEYDDLPLFNAWVNAEADRRELQQKSDNSGYSLSSWGATVGGDWDFSPEFTAGLALTAMYGDFQGKSADDADGDMDNYYLSLFARYAAHRWTNTLVVSLGRSFVSLNRHVYYPGGAYGTHGKTHGNSFGFLYELGYVIPLDENNQSCLQPFVNLSYKHISLDSYSEHGSDAALHIGRQRMNTVSFGFGVRAQTYALENAMNQTSLLDVRALLKLDAGDRRSDCEVELLALSSRRGRIRSAEAGRIGMEVGAGITIPIGMDTGHVFLDAGFEFRAEETEVNGTIGYRLTF